MRISSPQGISTVDQTTRTQSHLTHSPRSANSPLTIADRKPATYTDTLNRRISASGFTVYRELLTTETSDATQFIDITARVDDVIRASGVTDGQALVYSTHTTCSVIINENEPLLLKDMAHYLERQAPKAMYYGHNDFAIRTVSVRPNECPNGHAHCQHLVLGTSETVPVINSELLLGEFQKIFLVELDEPKVREFLVQVTGT